MKLKEKRASRRSRGLACLFAFTVAFGTTAPAVFADAISPNINEGDKIYSEERPNSAYFGAGMSGRLSEASSLRFTGEHFISEGKHDEAIKALSKAVQLEPDYPEGHVLLARAMTGKIKRSKTEVDALLMKQAIEEWQLISLHDAYYEDQLEARTNISLIKKIAKMKSKTQKKSKFGSLLAGKSFHFPW